MGSADPELTGFDVQALVDELVERAYGCNPNRPKKPEAEQKLARAVWLAANGLSFPSRGVAKPTDFHFALLDKCLIELSRGRSSLKNNAHAEMLYTWAVLAGGKP